jgi:GrpB-like predicted nucleotidyltransferase (UPF0157 family)
MRRPPGATQWRAEGGASCDDVAVSRDLIEVVEADAAWVDQYAEASHDLVRVLAPWLIDIAHIGSTAVPGLAAKPIIDIQIGVRSLECSDDIVSAVESLGYEYVPEYEDELPDRRYFRRSSGGRRTHHVHVVERSNTTWWDRHVGFRDWLRTHPEDRDRYAALKRQLAEEYGSHRRGYTEAKTAFIAEIEEKASVDRATSRHPWSDEPVDPGIQEI